MRSLIHERMLSAIFWSMPFLASEDTTMKHPLPFSNKSQPLTGPPSNAEEARHIEAMRSLFTMNFGPHRDSRWEDTAASERLDKTDPIVEEIRIRFKCPNISIGVLHKGKTPYTRGYGFTGVSARDAKDSTALYNTGFLTHSLTAMTLSLLEQAGRVSWDAPLSDYLPDLQTQQGVGFDEEVILGDLLSHCTGLAALPWAIRGKHSSVISRSNDVQHVFNNLPPVDKDGANWHYNEWAYAIIADIIDQLSDNPWEYCVENIIGRLGYPRTYIDHQVDDNRVHPYHVMEDGTQVPIDTAHKNGPRLRGSGSIKTCVNDMLNWCSFLITASKRKLREEECPLAIFPVSSRHETTLTRERLLKAAWTIQQPEFPLSPSPGTGQAYGLGLYTFKLPTKRINTISNSASMIMEDYIMGATSPSRKVIGNTSDLGTYTSTYYIFPETESAIIVLSNGSSVNGDATNIIAQLLTQALFNLQPPIDYLAVADLVSSQAIAQWQTTLEAWTQHQRPYVKCNPLSAYAGEYASPELQMTLSIKTTPGTQRANGDTGRIHANDIGRMTMCINNLSSQVFGLYSYHGDNWTFMPASRDECIKQGYGQYIQSWRSFIIKFDNFSEGKFAHLRWFLDPDWRVRAFIFQRVGMPKSPSSVYSQPDSTRASSEALSRLDSLRASEGGERAESEHVSGRYSDYVQ